MSKHIYLNWYNSVIENSIEKQTPFIEMILNGNSQKLNTT